MKAEYKRDINHNYLILEDEKGMDRSSYQVRMLLGNVIPSILRCHLQNLDGKNFYSYEITSKQSVASYYEGRKFHREDIRMILEGFFRVMEEMAEYLMNPEQLLIRPEYIYLDIESGMVFFCCLPEQGGEVQTQLREFIEYMLPKLDHEDQEAVFLGYGIYRKVLEPGFQLEMIKEASLSARDKGRREGGGYRRRGNAGKRDRCSAGGKRERVLSGYAVFCSPSCRKTFRMVVGGRMYSCGGSHAGITGSRGSGNPALASCRVCDRRRDCCVRRGRICRMDNG